MLGGVGDVTDSHAEHRRIRGCERRGFMSEKMGAPSPVVLFLAVGGRAGRLAAEHGNDGTGYCRTCSTGAQAGRQVWPCSLARLAAAAQELATGQPSQRRRADLQASGSGP